MQNRSARRWAGAWAVLEEGSSQSVSSQPSNVWISRPWREIRTQEENIPQKERQLAFVQAPALGRVGRWIGRSFGASVSGCGVSRCRATQGCAGVYVRAPSDGRYALVVGTSQIGRGVCKPRPFESQFFEIQSSLVGLRTRESSLVSGVSGRTRNRSSARNVVWKTAPSPQWIRSLLLPICWESWRLESRPDTGSTRPPTSSFSPADRSGGR